MRARRPSRVVPLAALLLALPLFASNADSQVVTRRRSAAREAGPLRTLVGGALAYASPQRDFKNYVSGAIGIQGHLVHTLDRAGVVGLRVEGGYLIYGSTTRRQPLGSGALGLVAVDVTTSNNIVFGGLGLQVMSPEGAVRPYVAGTIGFSYFFTESSVEGTSNVEPFASTKNFDDGGFSTMFGGGLYIPIARSDDGHPIALDLGLFAHTNKDVQYLTKNSIRVENTSSKPIITPVRSPADFVTLRVGVSVGLR